jgi:glycosyltransferase involved in cell wall biosynthesis
MYFIGALETGGSESHLARLLLALDRNRVAPELAVFQDGGMVLDGIRAAGIPVHPLGRSPGSRGFLKSLRRFRRVVGSRDPEVLHTFGYECDVYGPLSVQPRGRMKVVTTRRGNQPIRRRHMLYRATNGLADRVLCVSASALAFASRTEGLSGSKGLVIPNGIDLALFPEPPARPGPIRRIGTLGRLREVKGVDLLLDAYLRLERPEVTLDFGGPADSPWGDSFLARHDGTPGVRFVGEIDARPFLDSLDMFVLPSRSEGMSNALLEAMACGLPIVATDVGSNSELLGRGTSGVLVAPEPAAIAAGIRTLVDDPLRARALGTAARARVGTEFNFSLMVRRYEDFYTSLVAEP